MNTRLVVETIASLAAISLSSPTHAETLSQPAIPYMATRDHDVKNMLWLAKVEQDDVVYDLGSGDGRIVIAAVREFSDLRAVGVEIDTERLRESRANAAKAEWMVESDSPRAICSKQIFG